MANKPPEPYLARLIAAGASWEVVKTDYGDHWLFTSANGRQWQQPWPSSKREWENVTLFAEHCGGAKR